MAQNTSPFAINLGTGPTPEPPVSNMEFLDGYVRFGAWLRILPAFQQLQVLISPSTTPLRRVCATAVFYEQMGMLYEDTVCALVAWTAWARDRKLLLADVLKRIHLKPGGTSSTSTAVSYPDDISARLSTAPKRVEVNPCLFLQGLAARPVKQALSTIGIEWTHTPSAETVGPRERPDWDQLPMHTQELFKHISAPTNNLLSAYYNKIKHGPQVTVSNVREVAVARRGFPEERGEELPQGDHLRALLDGARTQERPEEHESGVRVAPFLLHDAYFVDKLFYEVMLFAAVGTWRLATWLQRLVLYSQLRGEFDPLLQAILTQAWSRASARSATS